METMNSGTGRRLRSGVNGKTCSRSSERVQKKLTGNFQVFSSFYPFKLVAGWRNNALFTESKVNSTFVSFIWTRRPCPSVRMKNGHVQALSWRRVTFPFFLLSVWMQLLWTTSREIHLTAGIGPAFYQDNEWAICGVLRQWPRPLAANLTNGNGRRSEKKKCAFGFPCGRYERGGVFPWNLGPRIVNLTTNHVAHSR